MDRETFARIVAGDWSEDLTRAEAEAFETLLDTDQHCRDLVAEAESELDELAAQWTPPEPEWDRVTNGIKAELNEPRKVLTPTFGAPPAGTGWNSPGLFAMAAAILFLAGISFVLGSLGHNPAGQDAFSTTTLPPKPKAIVLAKPAAEVVTLEAGTGYTASESVVDGDLLVVVLEQDS